MKPSITLTDELLVQALTRRTRHAPSAHLLDRIVAGAASAPQERQARSWLGRTGRLPRRPWNQASVVAGLAAAALVVVVVASLRPVLGPGGTPTPVTSPSPGVTPTPSSASLATPTTRLLGEFTAQRLGLGLDAAPIDVVGAFGSIWTANIHANDVRRFDPATMTERARIEVPGAAWFVVSGDALWVTNQTATGLTRIDPATNTVTARVGDVPPCGAPVVAFGSIWQSACDGDAFLQVEPASGTLIRSIPARGHTELVLVGETLVTMGPEGLARLDPATGALTPVSPATPTSGLLIGSDGETAWVRTGATVVRVDPADGRTVATLAYRDAAAVTFAGGRAWLSVPLVGVVEIDLATSEPRRTVPLLPTADIPREVDGVLWVTDFNNSALWRIEL